MNARKITASAFTLSRPPPRFKPIPNSIIWTRHASTKSNDEQTLAKSVDMLDALMGSTRGLDPKSAFASPPVRSTLPTRQAHSPPVSSSPSASATDMFIPPPRDPLLDYIAAVIQRHGLRARAARTVSRMLLHIHTFTRAPPTPVVREAIMTAAPAVRVVSFKYGTKVMMTPQPLTEKQRVRAGLKAIIAASESRPGKFLEIRLAREMIAVVQGESRSLDEKERLHKLAMVNRGNLRR